MSGEKPVVFIDATFDYSNEDAEGPELIRCVGGRKPQVNEVWTLGEDGVTREVRTKAQVDVGTGFIGEFATDYLTEIWRRFCMFGRNYINRSVQWLVVPDFLRTDGPTWTDNLLAPYFSLGDRGYTTNQNWGSQSGEGSDSVSVPCNRPVCVLPYYHRRIFENMRAAARRVCDDLLRGNRTVCMQSHSTFRNPIRSWLVNRWYDDWDDLWN